MINVGYSPMRESAEYLQATMPMSRKAFKELQDKFGGVISRSEVTFLISMVTRIS